MVLPMIMLTEPKAVPRLSAADEFLELRFKSGSWESQAIPEEGCWIRKEMFERLLQQGGSIEPADVILGLMDWLDVTDEPASASATLQRLLDEHVPAAGTGGRCVFQPDEGRELVLEVGAIDCTAPVVAWQRRGWIIALANEASEPGRLRVGAPGPISKLTAESILAHSATHFMMEPLDSFIAVRATAGRTGSFYTWEAGAVTATSWDFGLGVSIDGGDIGFDPAAIRPASWLSHNQLVAQIALAGGYE